MIGSLLVVLSFPLAARAEGSHEVQDYLVSVGRLYEELEYERALDQLTRAKRLARGADDEVALSLYEGILLAELGRKEDANAAFKAALFLRPDAKLPVEVAPKVQQQVESLRQKVKKEFAPILAKKEDERRRAEAEKQRLAKTEVVPQEAKPTAVQMGPAVIPARPAEVTPGRSHPGSRALIPAIAGGLLLAAGGVSFGLSKSEESRLRNDDVRLATLEDVKNSTSRGKTYQTVGLGLMGVGVMGLGVAAGLFMLDAPSKPLALGVGTDGTSAFVYGRWP